MKIGTWSFNDIVSLAFDKARVQFTALWLFIILAVSVLSSIVVNILLNAGVQGLGITIVDVLNVTTTLLVVLYIAIGVTASFKVKTKIKSFANLVKPLYIKQLLVVGLGVISIIIGLALAIVLGQITRIPVAGPMLMALLAIPFVIGLAYLIIFSAIALQLSAAAIIENPKASTKDIIIELLGITKNNFAKILFNGILLLFPLLIIALAVIFILGLAYLGYVFFGWAITGSYSVIALCMQGEVNAVYILQTISGIAILSYAASYFINVSLAGFYSIYLDARK